MEENNISSPWKSTPADMAEMPERIRTQTARTTATQRHHSKTTTGEGGRTSEQPDTSSSHGEESMDILRTTHSTRKTTRAPCSQSSGQQYNAPNKYTLDVLLQKCGMFHACIWEMQKSQSFSSTHAGQNIQLHNICGLWNEEGHSRTADSKCSPDARKAVKVELEEKLSQRLKNNSNPDDSKVNWQRLSNCLKQTSLGDENDLNKLCRLKEKSSSLLCNDSHVDKAAENIFNNKLRELQCSCDALTQVSPAAPSPLKTVVGISCGGALFIAVTIIIAFCIRNCRLQRRLTRAAKTSAFVTSPGDDRCSIYDDVDNTFQEVIPLGPVSEVIPVHCASTLQVALSFETFGAQCSSRDQAYDLPEHEAIRRSGEHRTRAGSKSERPDEEPKEHTAFEKADWSFATDNSPDTSDYSRLCRQPAGRPMTGPGGVAKLHADTPAVLSEGGNQNSSSDAHNFVLEAIVSHHEEE